MLKAYIFITNSDFGIINRSFEYLFGFQPSLAGMFLSEKDLYLFLDGRYFQKTQNINKKRIREILGNPNLKITFINSFNLIEDLIKLINKQKLKKVVFEGNNDILSYTQIKQKISCLVEIDKKGFFTEQRMIKREEEKQNIKKAIEIIDNVYEYILNLNKKGELIGKTELELRAIIISKIFEFGGNAESFDSIVAFGKNSAIPHHSSSNTIIQNGVLLIDMGAKYNSYCSDFTRTFWVGERNKQYNKFKKVYEIVKKAHNNAFLKAKENMTGKDIDFLARKVIEKENFGEYFIHSTGHGIGIDIHEKPFISKKSKDIIKNNMVFTIEPGIYFPQEFGVRLEDIVFMENGKLEKYSKISL